MINKLDELIEKYAYCDDENQFNPKPDVIDIQYLEALRPYIEFAILNIIDSDKDILPYIGFKNQVIEQENELQNFLEGKKHE